MAAGTLAALPVFVIGLVAPMAVIWPLTLAVAALAVVLGRAGPATYLN